FDGLRHSDPKIFRLLNEAYRGHFVGFRRINHVEAEDVFVRANAHMKTVAVICRIQNEPTIRKDNPVSGLIARGKVGRYAAEKSRDKNGDGVAQARKVRGAELAARDSKPHYDY